MVLLQEHHQPIRQLHTSRLHRLESMKCRHRNLLPRLHRHWLSCGRSRSSRSLRRLGEGKGTHAAQSKYYYPKSVHRNPHSAPPAFFAALAGAAANSMRALVRLLATKIWFATRRTSAFVTASTFFSWLNSSRQSPKRVWYSANWCASPSLSASPRSRSALVRVLYRA